MRDADRIVAMRMRKRNPAAIFLHVGKGPRGRSVDPDPIDDRLPVVWTDKEVAHLADLRFVIGLRVHLTMFDGDEMRYAEWFDALVEAGASEVIGTKNDGSIDVWHR